MQRDVTSVVFIHGTRRLIIVPFFSKLYHVRSVTQGDVIRADAKDIPRIFQVKLVYSEDYAILQCNT